MRRSPRRRRAARHLEHRIGQLSSPGEKNQDAGLRVSPMYVNIYI